MKNFYKKKSVFKRIFSLFLCLLMVLPTVQTTSVSAETSDGIIQSDDMTI